MKPGLGPGISGELAVVVEAPAMTIDIPGAGPVYSTPRMIRDLEVAAMNSLVPYLDPGEASVGVRVEVRHLAATAVGMRVTARARVVVETARFAARLAARRGKGA